MRQRRWLKLIKDYDLGILYHPRKVNVVADTLSRKKQVDVAAMITSRREIVEDLQRMDVEAVLGDVEAYLASLRLQPTLQSRIKEAQLKSSDEREKILWKIHHRNKIELLMDEEGTIRFGKWLWVPDEDDLRKEVLKEAHSFMYSIHPGSTKIYQDIKQQYWWENMKRDVVEYVSECLTSQQIRITHQ